MSSECTHCSRKFKTFEEYARHILEKHPTDDIRAGWAREVLYKPNESVVLTPSVESLPFPYVPPPNGAAVPETAPNEIDEALSVLLRPEVYERLKKLK